ncbi:HAD family hydrolase [Streptomyces sparsus]
MRSLISAADSVIFDFDGPLCRLFVDGRAADAATRLRALVDASPQDVTLSAPDDPHAVLRDVARQAPGTTLVQEVADALTREEVAAAPRAWPTAYVDALLMTLGSTGRRLAISTDNAPEAVQGYLAGRRLDGLFAGRVHGRRPDASRLKPDPDAVLRALESTGVPAERTVMIGDSPRDAEAAETAGVPFVGYARNDRKKAELLNAGVSAEHLVTSLLTVLELVNVAEFRPERRRSTAGA